MQMHTNPYTHQYLFGFECGAFHAWQISTVFDVYVQCALCIRHRFAFCLDRLIDFIHNLFGMSLQVQSPNAI